MTTRDDTSPHVFPIDFRDANYSMPVRNGITLRDLAALVALHELLKPFPGEYGENVTHSPQVAAEWAYMYADALLQAREK